MISHEKKCIFIHVPKTGGYTIKEVLQNYSSDKITKGHPCLLGSEKGWRMFPEKGTYDRQGGCMHPPISFYYNNYEAEVVENYNKFAFIRNPWDRILSYSIWLNGGGFDYNKLKEVIYTPGKNVGAGELTQLQYFKVHSEMKIDRYLRFENFADEIISVFNDLNIPCDAAHFKSKYNSTSHKHYSNYYEQKEIDAIREICKEEIEMFGFKFEERD